MLAKSLFKVSLIALTTIVSLDATAVSQSTQPHPVQVAQASTAELENIAKAITVQVHVGEHKGSGILIAKENNTYTVVTNAHVVDRGETIVVETPDGIKHTANVIRQTDTDQDLALVQFDSSNGYTVAEIDSSNDLSQGEAVVAAGFPYNSSELKITTGEISLLPDKSLQGGYQIGFTNETVQGMSGGVLLDGDGRVIGVLGKGKEAINSSSYNYTDGTTPDSEQLQQYRSASFSIPIANIVELDSSLAAILPDDTVAQSTTAPPPQPKREYTGIVGKVDQIAQAITVRIDNSNGSNGSGVIIARDGNTYYVATAKHVLCTSLDTPECIPTGEQQIVTPDGETHQLDYARVQAPQAWLDVAVFEFDSANDYQVASLGNYRTQDGQWLFVSGFPQTEEQTNATGLLTAGQTEEQEQSSFATKDKYSLDSNGQGLVYSNLSYGGMSGGAVLDAQGRVIGINTGAELDYTTGESINLGFSLGVAIQDFLGIVQKEDISLATSLLQLETTPADEITSVEEESIQQQLLTVTEPSEDTVAAWLNYANSLWRYEKYDQAVQAFERAIEIKPNTDQAYYGMGLALLSQGEFEQAAEGFKRATEINPNPYYYWRQLAISYILLNQYERTIQAYNTAIGKNNQDFVLYIERGDVFRQLQQYEQAIDDYNQAASLNPNHPWIYNNRGLVYADLQQYEAAIADYNKVLEINPQNADAYYNRGIVYDDLQQYQEALADYSRAIEINPQNASAYNNRGLIYKQLQQYEAAIADYTQAIKIDPQHVNAYNNRGRVYDDLQQYEAAIADYNKAIEVDPQLAEAYNNRGSVYFDLQQYEAALAEYNKALEIDPQNASAYNNRGFVYQNMQQYESAIADYTQAIKIDPQHVNAYGNRGITYYLLGNLALARQDIEQTAQLFQQQNNPQAYQAVQETLQQLEIEQRQQYEAALAEYNKAIKIDPQDADAYYNRGNLYFEQQQYREALADYSKVIEINPQDADAYYNRGLVYHQQKNYRAALDDYQKALTQSEYWQAYANTGLIYYESGDLDGAIAQWQKSLQIDPESAEPQLALAVALYTQGNQQQGLEMAKTALQKDSRLAEVEFLQENLWGDRLITSTQKLLEDTRLQVEAQ